MNPFLLRRIAALLLVLITVLAAFPLVADPRDEIRAGTAIMDVRAVGDQLQVTVRVPLGKRRVTLEARPRLHRGTWTPCEVKWTDGSQTEIIFKVPLGDGMEMLQVRDEEPAELALPATFFAGPKAFAGVPGVGNPAGVFPGAVGISTDVAVLPSRGEGGDSGRAVVESDIWFVDGDTLYFYNQQRGLQVIDLANPDAPALRGTLPLASWSEQMYRLPAAGTPGVTWLALLAQQGCDNNSEVLLVRVENGRPEFAGRLPVPGQVRESRLVGDALYVASYEWIPSSEIAVRDAQGNVAGYQYVPWESRTTISAFDLAVPASPVVQPPLSVSATPDAIAATDRYLFVATTGTVTPGPNERVAAWAVQGNHGVLVFDISDPHGVTSQVGALLNAGRVADKFKLNLRNDVLTVVSQKDGVGEWVTNTKPGGFSWIEWQWRPPQAVLETFSLTNPAAPVRLGGLTLVTNESVFGTRFDGDRAYVVTFRRVDPLWIVDLADPANPRVTGELEVPGFSNYLHPLGNRLLAMGVEGGQAAVSLFDVADPARPMLVNKLLLGEGWSDSEANRDEKAFQVFPDAGLLLVPWNGQRKDAAGEAKWFQGVQLVDFTAARLKARGVIDHAFQARRATLRGDRIVSISSQELLSVEAADRDQPNVRATLELSRVVDRVLVAGTQLVQLQNGWSGPPQLTLTTQAEPDRPLATLAVAGPPITGAIWRDGLVYLLQVKADEWRSEAVDITNLTVMTSWTSKLVPGETTLSVVAAGLGTLELRGRVTLANPTNFFGGSFTALWPRDGVLVWTDENAGGWGWPMYLRAGVADFAPGAGLGGAFWYPWWRGTGVRHFLAFDVTQPAAPAVASVTTLGADNTQASAGKAFTADGKVYAGHSLSRWADVLPAPGGTKPGAEPQPFQQWETTWWLDVLDYADATEPVVRPPASLPGELAGVSHAGALLYARGAVPNPVDGTQALHALAYDGLAASQVTSLVLPNTWPQPLVVRPDGVVWLGRSPATTNETPALETWSVSVAGQFERQGSRTMSGSVTDLLAFPDVLVAVEDGVGLNFLDPAAPAALVPLGIAPRPCQLWVSGGNSDATRARGLWLARSAGGLWHFPISP